MSSVSQPALNLARRVRDALDNIQSANARLAKDQLDRDDSGRHWLRTIHEIEDDAKWIHLRLEQTARYETYSLLPGLPHDFEATDAVIEAMVDAAGRAVRSAEPLRRSSGWRAIIRPGIPAGDFPLLFALLGPCFLFAASSGRFPEFRALLYTAGGLQVAIAGLTIAWVRVRIRRNHNAICRAVEGMARAIAAAKSQIRAWHAQRTRDIQLRWENSLHDLRPAIAQISREVRVGFPPWGKIRIPSGGLNSLVLSIPFGWLEFRDPTITQILSGDESNSSENVPTALLPALLNFPTGGSVMIKIAGTGDRQAALDCLRALTLRVITTFPPGKARFTFIDPEGFGESFATFMHLFEHNPALVNSRIWTEEPRIEQQLENLTRHMEDVFQTYLRGAHQTIAEYNERAGDLAEAYRFLVIANFPAGFSAQAVERLLRIASTGGRCGVYVFLTVDTSCQFPRGHSLVELEKNIPEILSPAATAKGRWEWLNGDGGLCFARPEQPPDHELFVRILNSIGRECKAGQNVSVPFRSIAPQSKDYWGSGAAAGIAVPLGPSGVDKTLRGYPKSSLACKVNNMRHLWHVSHF